MSVGKGENAWDHHGTIFPAYANEFMPELDQAFSALLDRSGTARDARLTLVLVTGEFGRTAEINVNNGRDHWPNCFSLVLAGAGVPKGQVVGESDAEGMYVKDRPVEVPDLMATILKKCGVSFEKEYLSNIGRPIKIAEGRALNFWVSALVCGWCSRWLGPPGPRKWEVRCARPATERSPSGMRRPRWRAAAGGQRDPFAGSGDGAVRSLHAGQLSGEAHGRGRSDSEARAGIAASGCYSGSYLFHRIGPHWTQLSVCAGRWVPVPVSGVLLRGRRHLPCFSGFSAEEYRRPHARRRAGLPVVPCEPFAAPDRNAEWV